MSRPETTSPERAGHTPDLGADIQLRGHCQCCGRLQAVVRGRVAQHGYDVADGYFRGVCAGHRYAPMEQSRIEADATCTHLRVLAATHERLADDIEAGRELPRYAGERRDRITRKWVRVPFAEANAYDQADALKRAPGHERYLAVNARRDADTIAALADRVHGQPLAEVPRDAGPAPIAVGERRSGPTNRVLVAHDVYAGRVTYRVEGSDSRGRLSSRAWRLLPMAPAAIAAATGDEA